MTERVEEIRRMYDAHMKHCPDGSGLCHWNGHSEVRDLLAALAQAEQEQARLLDFETVEEARAYLEGRDE